MGGGAQYALRYLIGMYVLVRPADEALDCSPHASLHHIISESTETVRAGVHTVSKHAIDQLEPRSTLTPSNAS